MNTINSMTALAVVAANLFYAQTARADGDLTVGLVDGTLYVLGDREANDIHITEFEGLICVRGCDSILDFWCSNGTTTVNGGNLECFAAADVTDVIVVASGGDDVLNIAGSFSGDVSFDCGVG